MRGKCRAQGKDERKMKIAKQIIGFLLALSLPLVLIACGDGTDTPKGGGSKRQYDDSVPAELEGDKYNLHNYSLETADGNYYDENGEKLWDAADGVAHTKNYRNDVTASCKLASGYTVTLGMGDASVGTGAIYLNPTTDNPKGTTYLWSKYNHKTNSSMTGRVEFDYEAERKRPRPPMRKLWMRASKTSLSDMKMIMPAMREWSGWT